MGNCCSMCKCCCCADKDVIPPSDPKEKLIVEKPAPVVVNNSTTHNVLITNSEVHNHNVVVVESAQPVLVEPSPSPAASSSAGNSFKSVSTPISIKTDIEDQPVDPVVVSKSPPVAFLMPKVLSPKHRAMSSRSSFTQTKEHREFRCFLPILEESDDFLSAEDKEAYTAALDLVRRTFKESEDDEDTEVRDDTYLIGRSYFGLKYRDDSKLEMKVKTENKPIWQEKWSKVRFGKKQIGHYKADIMSYLSDVGHKDPANERFIDEPRFITIHKSRDVNQLERANIELGELSVAEKQLSELKCEIKRRRWLTLSIEGDSNTIEGLVYQHISSGTGVWGVFELTKRLFEANPERAAASHFMPVISGYPLWIEVLGSTFNTPESVQQEIFPAVDAFVGFLKAQ